MKHYYVSFNAHVNGHNEVHELTCKHIPSASDRAYLGFFSSIEEAILEAKKKYIKPGGCMACCVPHYMS